MKRVGNVILLQVVFPDYYEVAHIFILLMSINVSSLGLPISFFFCLFFLKLFWEDVFFYRFLDIVKKKKVFWTFCSKSVLDEFLASQICYKYLFEIRDLPFLYVYSLFCQVEDRTLYLFVGVFC